MENPYKIEEPILNSKVMSLILLGFAIAIILTVYFSKDSQDCSGGGILLFIAASACYIFSSKKS